MALVSTRQRGYIELVRNLAAALELLTSSRPGIVTLSDSVRSPPVLWLARYLLALNKSDGRSP
jgi:hypothetical protein